MTEQGHQNSMIPPEDWKNYREEIRKIQRGVRLMWGINFLFLTAVFTAVGIVAFMPTTLSNEEIFWFVTGTAGISAVIALIAMLIVVANSRRFVASGLGNNAQEVTEGMLYNVVEEVTIGAGMRQMPRVYVSSENVMNAYALGDSKGNAYVAVTKPLLDALNRDELTGVMAHEVAHIQSGDSPAMVKLIALSSMIGLVASLGWRMLFYGGRGRGGGNRGGGGVNPVAIALIIVSLVFLILAPFLAKLSNAFMSRQRETRADRLAVKYTRNPTALAMALYKINNSTAHAVEKSSQAKQDAKDFNDAVGALAFYKPSFIGKAFATHPPFEKRLSELEAMGSTHRSLIQQ